MTTSREYIAAHNSVKRLYGPARNHPCDFCALRASEWALDWEAPEIIRDQYGYAYTNDPDWYVPLCVKCHRAYDNHVAKYGYSSQAVLLLRDKLRKAVDPELRRAVRPSLENSFTAVQMWLSGADDVVDRRVNTFDLMPEPEHQDEPDAWFTELFALDSNSVLLGADAYGAYLDWCDTESVPARARWGRKTFYSAMSAHGCTRKATSKGIALVGVRLAA